MISHPFRLDQTGAVAVVDEGTTRANAEAIAILAGTRRGERGMVPEFGVTDPAFAELDIAEISSGLQQYGPDGVTITGVAAQPATDTSVRVTLTFDED